MRERIALPDVFAFDDARAFLAALLAAQEDAGLTATRAFLRRAGVRSVQSLRRVIDGTRTLPPATAWQLAYAAGLADAEARCFVALVAAGQAETPAARDEAAKELAQARSARVEPLPNRRVYRIDASALDVVRAQVAALRRTLEALEAAAAAPEIAVTVDVPWSRALSAEPAERRGGHHQEHGERGLGGADREVEEEGEHVAAEAS